MSLSEMHTAWDLTPRAQRREDYNCRILRGTVFLFNRNDNEWQREDVYYTQTAQAQEPVYLNTRGRYEINWDSPTLDLRPLRDYREIFFNPAPELIPAPPPPPTFEQRLETAIAQHREAVRRGNHVAARQAALAVRTLRNQFQNQTI